MSDKNTGNNEQMPAVAKIEYAYSFALKVMVTITAITSMLVTYRLGGLVAELFGASTLVGYLLRNFFVFLGLGFDLIVMNALGAISMPNSRSRVVWVLAVVALLVTLVLSVVSGRFFSEETSGPSHYHTYQEQLLANMHQDSSMKSQALQLVASAGEEERLRIQQANTEATTLLEEAIAKGSERWQQDYQQAKDKPRAWFWVCSKCPKAYRNYRDGIKAAIEEGNSRKAAAAGYSQQVAAMVSPTLSADVSQDSSMIKLEQATLKLEEERERRAGQLFLILAAFSVGGGLMAILLALGLKHHRAEHGQYIDEDHIGPILLLFDLLGKARQILLDLVQSLLFRPYQQLIYWNVIQPYVGPNNRWSLVPRETNNQQSTNTNTNKKRQQSQTNNQRQQPKDTNTEPNQQQKERPTKSDCKDGKCPPKGKNNTAGKNRQLKAGAEDLVKVAERCRIRYKRSFTAQTAEARQRNHDGALADGHWLTQQGADVFFDASAKKAKITLPKE